MSRPFRTGGERMKSAIAFIAVLAVLLLVASCTKTPDEVFSSLRLETGIKAPLVATSVRLGEITDQVTNSVSSFSLDVDPPSFDLSEASFTVGDIKKTGSPPFEASITFSPSQTATIPITSGIASVTLNLPMLIKVVVNDDPDAKAVIENLTMEVKDNAGNKLNHSETYYTNPIVSTIDDTAEIGSSVGNLNIEISEITIITDQASISTLTVYITPLKEPVTVPNVISYESENFGTTNLTVDGCRIFSLYGLNIDQKISVPFPSDLQSKGVKSVKINNGKFVLAAEGISFEDVTSNDGNFKVSNGEIVYDLSGFLWNAGTSFEATVNSVSMSFGEAGISLSNLETFSLKADPQITSMTFDFGTTGATIFEITPDPIKLSLGEGLTLSSATLTIEGTNTTCFKPELKISIDGNERESITLGETFTGTITFKEEDFGKMTGDGLPLSFKVIAKGQHTIDLTKPGDIRFNLLIDTDAAVGGGE